MKFPITPILILLFAGSCQKEYSFENGGIAPVLSIASYSLANAGGNCPDVLVNGVYTDGIPLTSANTISIKVIVDSIGSYSLTTNNINGISFSASGNFNIAGEQTINLKGNGTPEGDGDFDYNIGTGGCTFSVSAEPKPIGTAVITFDGYPGPCTNISRGGVYNAGVPLTGSNIIKIDVNVVIPGSYSIETPLSNGILFSGTGILETPGYGVVILIASGTPVADGVFDFTPTNNGCPFSVSVDP
jgi:hypothetical protein